MVGAVQIINSQLGVEILDVPFERIVVALRAYDVTFDVTFDWLERDRDTPREAWEIYAGLTGDQRQAIANEILSETLQVLNKDIVQVLETDINQLPHRISEVEILLKTDQEEILLLRFDSAAEGLAAMAKFVADRPDISGLLQSRSH